MCTLAPARAQEVQIGIEQQLNAESNVFKTNEDPFADAFYRIRPRITVAQPETNFTYDIEYRPSFQAYFRSDDINGFDHVARARSSYQFNARDTVNFLGEYLNVRSIRADSVLDVNGQPIVTRDDNGRSERLLAELSLDHSFSGRMRGSLGVRYDEWRYTTQNNVDNAGFGGEGQLTYAFFERLVLGANVDARYRKFEQVSFSPGSRSTVLNTNVLAQLQLTPTLDLHLSGGPAVVFTDQDLPAPQEVSRFAPRLSADGTQFVVGQWGPNSSPTGTCGTINGVAILSRCTPVPAAPLGPNIFDTSVVGLSPNQTLFGQSTTNTTYFVSVRLSKRFARGSASVSFVRNEDAGSGFGTVTILNSATGRVAYSVNDLWRVSLVGVFTQRDAASQLPSTSVSAQTSGIALDGTPTVDPAVTTFAEASELIPNPTPLFSEQRISWIEANATRNLSQNTYLQFKFRYYRQSQFRSNRSGETSLDNLLGAISFFYEFEPFKL